MKKYRSTIARILVLAALIPVFGCGGDSDSPSGLPNFSGLWDIRYNFNSDECRIVLGGVPGFVDQHEITQDGGAVTLVSQSGLIGEGSGAQREDGSITAEETVEGDIFGVGVPCELYTGITYNSLSTKSSDGAGDTAQSIFVQTIECADGYVCESQAVGSAVRQPTL